MDNNETQEAVVVKDDQPQEAVVVAQPSAPAPVQQTSSIEPMALIEMALQNDQVDQLEKLMALQERWEQQQAKKQYNLAVAEFQKNMPTIHKDKEGEVRKEGRLIYTYKYASLGNIQNAIKEPLSEVGLSYEWAQEKIGDNMIRVWCISSHVAGYEKKTYMDGEIDSSGGKNAIQSRRSTVSYLRRSTLEDIYGIVAEDDDDGQQGVPVSKQENKPAGKPELNPDQLKRSIEKYRNFQTTMKEIQKYFKVSTDQKKEFRKSPDKGHWHKITEGYKTGDLTAEQITNQFDLTDQQKEQLESL